MILYLKLCDESKVTLLDNISLYNSESMSLDQNFSYEKDMCVTC